MQAASNDPVKFADELDASIHHAILAHTHHPKTPDDAIRFWDRTTPYAIHPIWCAVMLLTETTLPAEIRYHGYQALLWHDTLEDTTLPLPPDTPEPVCALVHEMTFANFAEEQEKLWERSDTAKLLKLYDKVSILFDAVWMSDRKWNRLVAHAQRLLQFVEATYGELNIVKIARVICQPRQPTT
jgi:hypothetical protein